MEASTPRSSEKPLTLCDCIQILYEKGHQQTPLTPTDKAKDADDFFQSTGLDLHEVLWAFALMLDSTRTGANVTATVLRKAHNKDTVKPTIILHVARNRALSENERDYRAFHKCKQELEKLVRMREPSPSEDKVKDAMMKFFKGRISGYFELAKEVFKNTKTYEEFQQWNPTEERLHPFAGKVKLLLKLMKDTLEKEKDGEDKPIHQSQSVNRDELLYRACIFLDEYGETFNKIWSASNPRTELPHGMSRLQDDNIKIYPYFKTIENFAKLPRAIHTFVKFCKWVASSGFLFEISPIYSNHNTTAGNETPEPLPHCEMQLLQYFEQVEEVKKKEKEYKAKIWNVIGCSKRPCYCCSFVINHGSDFTFKDSHGKIYFPWLLPLSDVPDSRLRAALTKLRYDLTDKISEMNNKKDYKRRSFTEPDSPTCMKW